MARGVNSAKRVSNISKNSLCENCDLNLFEEH